jgi:hypothetical protein
MVWVNTVQYKGDGGYVVYTTVPTRSSTGKSYPYHGKDADKEGTTVTMGV